MQPSLALSYNSQRRRDSWVGYGWSLGLGGIRRSLRRGVPSYDDERDEFELAGQRLVPDPEQAGRFHTRRESFLQIDRLASGGWEVRSPDGTLSRYGTSETCRIERAPGETYEWLLCERIDPRGNALAVSYDRRDPGSAYLSEIRYTLRVQGERLESLPGGDRIVRFETEPRPDPFQGRIKGLLEQQRRRLTRVLLLLQDDLIRRYDLNYEQSPDSGRSLLVEITERGPEAGAQEQPRESVSRSTRFTYHSNVTAGTQGWELAPDWEIPGEFATSQGFDGGARLGDVNGDGLPDLVVAKRVDSELSAEDLFSAEGAEFTADSGVYLNTGSGFEMAPTPPGSCPLRPSSWPSRAIWRAVSARAAHSAPCSST